MNRIRNIALLLAMAGAFAGTVPAQSTFSGTFVYPLAPDLTAICGGIHVTIGNGQLYFQSTLFRAWASGSSLEPVLAIQGMDTPFSFGPGTPGSWELGEFFGLMPGITPVPPGEPPVDPGFGLPVYFDGMRFSGSFTTPVGLEDALLTGAGVLRLQIHGTVNLGGSPVQDPLISAVLLPVPEPGTWVLLGLSVAMLAGSRAWRKAHTFILCGGLLCGAGVGQAAPSAFTLLAWEGTSVVDGQSYSYHLMAGRSDFTLHEIPRYAFYLPDFLGDATTILNARFLTQAGEFSLLLGTGATRMEWFDVYADPRNPAPGPMLVGEDPLSGFPVFISTPSPVWVGRFFDGDLPADLASALGLGSARVEIWSGQTSTGLGGEVALVPEPSTVVLLCVGGGLLALRLRRVQPR